MDLLRLGIEDLRGDGPHDAPRQLLLDREDVLEHPVVSLRPDVVAAQRVDQLAGDPDSIDRLADAAFQDVADTELARDDPHVHGRPL